MDPNATASRQAEIRRKAIDAAARLFICAMESPESKRPFGTDLEGCFRVVLDALRP